MKFKGLLLAVVMLIGCVASGFGQSGSTGTILGTVSDSSGAAVAGATIIVTNKATGVTQTVQTGDSGEYTAPSLPPGVYSVVVDAKGFGKQTTNNITLVVAQQSRVNSTLQPGTLDQTVEVSAGAVALDTDSSAVTQLVSERQVNQLPLNGRNFLSLLFIGAGAVQTVGEQGQMRQGEGNAISINGSRPESNNYTLDGMVNIDTALNTPAVILSQDAIQEFKVQNATYGAEYGFSANQVNIVSKSGGNQLHGSLFDFARNDAFDANTHFIPVKPVKRQHQFGFVASGPVYIPKLYDGRNKTFWLANYEGWRIKNGTSSYSNVAPIAQVNGNFSGSGLPAISSASCTTAINAGNACMPIDPLTGQPFPNNTIPSSRFSRLAAATLGANLFVAPNCTTSGCLGNYRLSTLLPNTTDQQTYKLDQTLGRFGSVFGRYTKADYVLNTVGRISLPSGLNIFTENSTSWEIAHTISLGSRNVNNFRYGRLGAVSIQGSTPAPASFVSALGFTGTFTSLPDYARGYPSVAFQNLSGTVGSPGNNPTTSDIPVWEVTDSFTTIHGRHTIGIGFDYRSWVQKRNLSTNFLGSFAYNNDLIKQNGGNGTVTVAGTVVKNADPNDPNAPTPCPTVTCATGNAVADFLLGYYHDTSTFQPGPFSTAGVAGNLNKFHFKYFAPYVQDDWKVNNRLTLNLGLRWDFRGIPYEENDKMFWFDTANTKGGLCFARQELLTDGIAPVGNGFYRYCGRRNPKSSSLMPFAPRIGFALRPFGDNATVVRGGYGVYFDSSGTREIDNSGDLYPFVTRAALAPISQKVPKLTDQLFPALSAPTQVTIAAQGSQFFAVIISENPMNPYVQQWSLSVERELAKNTTLEVNYVGNKGTHLLERTNINQPRAVANPALCQADVKAGDCPIQGRRPLQNITAANGALDSRWTGYSNYNSGNVKLERRSADMALVAVYTYSKSMDRKSAAAGIGATNGFAGHLDENNPDRDYARSDFDVGQRFVVSYVYELPFGKGKHFVNNANRLTDAAIGGWQITGIGTFQKGFPFSVLANDTGGLLNAFNQRANIIGDPHSGAKTLDHWFNTAAFSQPLAGAFGSGGRNILREPGISNWDMGLIKSLSFTEGIKFQLRVETFNTFNHAQYGVDPSSPSSAAGGPGTGAVDRNVNDQGTSTNQNFGRVVSARPGRVMQLGGKLTF